MANVIIFLLLYPVISKSPGIQYQGKKIVIIIIIIIIIIYLVLINSVQLACVMDVCMMVNVFTTEALDSEERLMEMKRILTEELPADNYFVLKYIVHFLTEVCYHRNYDFFYNCSCFLVA